MGTRPRASAILRGFVLLAGYLAVVGWLTWPLAASLASATPFASDPCLFDTYYSAWALSHESYALVSATTHFADGNIYHPATGTLFYGPAPLGALPLFAPVFLTTGNPALALNVTFLLGLALTGVALHVIVQRWTGSFLAGVIGAVTVLADQWLIWGFVPTAPHWASLYCLPLIAFVAATRMDSFRSALWLAPLVAVQCLVDVVYLAPAVLGPLGVLAGLRFLRRRTRAAALRLVVVTALAALALLPVYRGYMAVKAANPRLAIQTEWTWTEANLPSQLPGSLYKGGRPFLVTPVAMGLIPLGIVAAVWRRQAAAALPIPGGWAHGFLWALVGGVLALHPTATLAGMRFTTPLSWAQSWTPSLQAIRVPARLGIAGLVGLGILSGVAFGEITALLRTWVRRPSVVLAVSAGLAALVVHLTYRGYFANYWIAALGREGIMPAAYRLQPLPTIPPSFVPVLAASRVPLIEVPIGYGIEKAVHARAMFHSIFHRHPILNGYSSYWPAGFSERMIEAARLPTQSALDHLADTTGLALIWVNEELLTPQQRLTWAYPRAPSPGHHGFVLVAHEVGQLLFAVTPPSAPTAGAH